MNKEMKATSSTTNQLKSPKRIVSNRSNFKQCVVAVGSTEFSRLIETLDVPTFYTRLELAGFTDVLFQIGHGKHEPQERTTERGLKVHVHKFIVLDE